MRLQPIYDIAQLCSLHGITDAVVCPGSRCAPLTLAFSRHPKMRVRTFSDERSAAFIALGLAQQTGKPVVLICTSGSAAYNFAPALAEAFYSHVPVLVLTADRPKEWIGQFDGQTIRQENIYGDHVKKYFELPADYEHPDAVWFIQRTVNEAIHLAQRDHGGPVHINIPLREPLYPAKEETILFSESVKIVTEEKSISSLSENDWHFIQQQWPLYKKVAVVGGQGVFGVELTTALHISNTIHAVALLGDVISNLHGIENVIRYSDSFLAHSNNEIKESLKPELLITFGRSVISKNLKVFLRKYKPAQHWHITEGGEVADTFQSLTRIIRCEPSLFFEKLNSLAIESDFEHQKRENFNSLWKAEEHKMERAITQFFSSPQLSEFHFVHAVMQSLPKCNLHLANSMTVRYANFIGLKNEKDYVTVYSNRGTSGIDGCTSTTIGHALASGEVNVLITGDLAFFYDRNAFWHNYSLPNLRIVVLNNHGGVIFGLIDGPGELPEAEEFFITRQKLSAKHLCQEFGIEYIRIDNIKKMKNTLHDFFEPDGKPRLIEMETDSTIGKKTFEQFKQLIKQGYES